MRRNYSSFPISECPPRVVFFFLKTSGDRPYSRRLAKRRVPGNFKEIPVAVKRALIHDDGARFVAPN